MNHTKFKVKNMRKLFDNNHLLSLALFVSRTAIAKRFIVFYMIIASTFFATHALANDTESKLLIGEVTKIYMSSMVYIFKNQPLINGNSFDKSALQGEKFIDKIKEVYEATYQESFPATDHYIKRVLIETMIEVMADNQPLLDDSDITFKGIIPATFAFQLSAKLSTKGIGLKIKFTRTKDSIRNVLNTPDEWESSTMQKIIKKPQIFYDNNAYINKKPAFRQFTPLPMAGYCLACHGSPADNPLNHGKSKEYWTDYDMTGFKMEGWSMTDFGGGVSISIEKDVLTK